MYKYLIASSFLILASCGGGGNEAYDSSAPRAPHAVSADARAMPAPVPMAEGLSDGESVGNGAGTLNAGADVQEQFIAYSYRMGMRLPVAQIEPVIQSHTERCRAAGPSKCIVINSSLNKQSEDYSSASLIIRAVPDWIDTFRTDIEADAENAKGEISFRQSSAEDLTRAIIDTDARLTAQSTLRDRLENLLENREGELADLLATERELARVNGQIDSIKSNLKAMRLRVSMSDLNVSYETKRSPVSRSAFKPLGSAFADFFYNLSSALAAVVTAFAVGLPWLVLLGVMLWVWLRLIWPGIRRPKVSK